MEIQIDIHTHKLLIDMQQLLSWYQKEWSNDGYPSCAPFVASLGRPMASWLASKQIPSTSGPWRRRLSKSRQLLLVVWPSHAWLFSGPWTANWAVAAKPPLVDDFRGLYYPNLPNMGIFGDYDNPIGESLRTNQSNDRGNLNTAQLICWTEKRWRSFRFFVLARIFRAAPTMTRNSSHFKGDLRSLEPRRIGPVGSTWRFVLGGCTRPPWLHGHHSLQLTSTY